MKRFLVFTVLAVVLSAAAVADSENSAVGRQTKSFTVAKGGDLEVNISGGDIRLVPWGKDEVMVAVDGITDEDKDDLMMSQEGKTIHIDFHPRWGSSGDIKFIVSLPAQFNADVNTSGGDISVDGVMTGKLKGSTSGGDIRTGAIEGPTTLRTSGGDIRLGKINGEADVKTSGGDVRIESVTRNVNAATSGGDMEVGDIGGEATLKTSGGDIRAGKVTGKAVLKTAGGNITLSSASGTAEATTAGGNIRLENITGSITARTAGGDVNAELIPSGSGSSDLRTAAGNVVLTIPSNAKATIDATIKMRGSRRHQRNNGEFKIHSDFKSETETISGTEQGEDIHSVIKINGGGERITITTSDGNIEIRKMAK